MDLGYRQVVFVATIRERRIEGVIFQTLEPQPLTFDF